MISGRKIITLCGSTKFKKDFERVNKELSLKGNVVISVAYFGHSEDTPPTTDEKLLLDRVHLAKIDLADEIYVINTTGYIGESTRREIDYARNRGRAVTFMEPLKANPIPSNES